MELLIKAIETQLQLLVQLGNVIHNRAFVLGIPLVTFVCRFMHYEGVDVLNI